MWALTLRLQGNAIGKSGVCALVEALEHNSSLTALYLPVRPLSRKGWGLGTDEAPFVLQDNAIVDTETLMQLSMEVEGFMGP